MIRRLERSRIFERMKVKVDRGGPKHCHLGDAVEIETRDLSCLATFIGKDELGGCAVAANAVEYDVQPAILIDRAEKVDTGIFEMHCLEPPAGRVDLDPGTAGTERRHIDAGGSACRYWSLG